MDSPRAWTDWTLESIFAMRASLLRGRRLVDVHAPRDSVVEAAQLLAQASKPATVEVTLEKDPPRDLRAALEGFAAPLGPGVDARAARVVENPVIPRKVDALVNDLDAPAGTAATELYDGGIDAYHIQRLLSAGVLGVGRRRRLVPTRWSITATDDILGKELIARAKRLPEVGGIRHHAAELFGNRFHVLLLPRAWSFEMLESWQRGAMWASGEVLVQDWEPWEGRSDYADNITGAYYAARLGVLEHLLRTRRQASVVVYREITPAYYMELGVWVIREGVRKALDAPAHRPVSVAAALAEVGKGVGLQDWHRKSVLLDRFLRQRRITDFQG